MVKRILCWFCFISEGFSNYHPVELFLLLSMPKFLWAVITSFHLDLNSFRFFFSFFFCCFWFHFLQFTRTFTSWDSFFFNRWIVLTSNVFCLFYYFLWLADVFIVAVFIMSAFAVILDEFRFFSSCVFSSIWVNDI